MLWKNMKEKIVIICFIGIFLVASISAVSGLNIKMMQNFEKQGNMKIENEVFQMHVKTEGIKMDISSENKLISKNNNLNGGELDLEITDLIAWMSPMPDKLEDYPNDGYMLFQVKIVNVGDNYYSNDQQWLSYYIYEFYLDETTNKTMFPIEYPFKSWEKNGGMFVTIWSGNSRYEKPLEMGLEIKTTAIESNTNNNEMTSPVYHGVTFNGSVTKRNILGEEKPVGGVTVESLADESHFADFYDFDITDKEYGWYWCSAPLIQPHDGSPYECNLRAKYALESFSQTKKFENLSGGEMITHHFVFKSKAKSVNLPYFNFVHNLINRLPLLTWLF